MPRKGRVGRQPWTERFDQINAKRHAVYCAASALDGDETLTRRMVMMAAAGKMAPDTFDFHGTRLTARATVS